VTFFLILSLPLLPSSLHITQEHGTFPSRLSCEDYLEDLALHLRLPADTKVRAPVLSVGSGAHSRDHTGDRTGGGDLGAVPHRLS
jgi:hypothetical protein